MIVKERFSVFIIKKTNKIICGSGNKLRKPTIQEESKDDIIKNKQNLCKLKKEIKQSQNK